MDFCPLCRKDIFALKTENTEIGVKGISTRRQKHEIVLVFANPPNRLYVLEKRLHEWFFS